MILKNGLISCSLVWNSLTFYWACKLLSSTKSLTSPSRLVAAENTSKGMWSSGNWRIMPAFKLHCTLAYRECFSPQSNSISPGSISVVFFIFLGFFLRFFLSLYYFHSFFYLLPSELCYYLLPKVFQKDQVDSAETAEIFFSLLNQNINLPL